MTSKTILPFSLKHKLSHKNEEFMTIPLITTSNLPFLGTGPRNTIYDYNTTSTPQPYLLNRSLPLSAGKVIGGSSAINGMVFMRGNAAEYDHWEELGNIGWNWDGLFPYFKKSEHFTPADEEEVKEWEIGYDGNAHGEKGFVENGFPNFVWPSTSEFPFLTLSQLHFSGHFPLRFDLINHPGNFLNAFFELGVSYLKDSLSGLNTGVFFYLLSITPNSQERCTSQSFLPPNSQIYVRSNLHVLTSHTVTKILFSSNSNSSNSDLQEPRAIGVEYAASINDDRYTVKARKEIILSAGAQRTPQILQISGIGRRDLLEGLGIEVIVESEGVGENYHDHLLFATFGPGMLLHRHIK